MKGLAAMKVDEVFSILDNQLKKKGMVRIKLFVITILTVFKTHNGKQLTFQQNTISIPAKTKISNSVSKQRRGYQYKGFDC